MVFDAEKALMYMHHPLLHIYGTELELAPPPSYGTTLDPPPMVLPDAEHCSCFVYELEAQISLLTYPVTVYKPQPQTRVRPILGGFSCAGRACWPVQKKSCSTRSRQLGNCSRKYKLLSFIRIHP